MRTFVCDDDAQFAEKLKGQLLELSKRMRWRNRVDCITNTDDLKHTDFTTGDIIFLDIDMGTVNGIKLARHIRAIHNDVILIFVTNFVEYSLEGYEVEAFRYLLKSELDEKLPACFEQAVAAWRKGRNVIRFSCEGNEVDVLPGHLIYAETEQRRIKLHLCNEVRDTLLISTTMTNLDELLKDCGFLRIHQSYLVNMAYIQKIQSTGVWLRDGSALPISARNYSALKQEYLRWKGMKRWSIT